ncbi:semaphorin-4F [Erpetoichthys calabaricus]|uniref:semaphorin-4F n=1 Tax=Erpetoichthys calabaricus TaxID=27687 RepID=UPI0022348733|nr:semaphorin-4F [Erpetoichthys calabaricus]
MTLFYLPRSLFWVLHFTFAVAMKPVPRLSSTYRDLDPHLVQQFSSEGISNYSVLLLHPESDTLYVGAKNAIFALKTKSLNENPRTIHWNVSEINHKSCRDKGKSEAECHNYVRLLEFYNATHIYACGTYAYNPQCTYISMSQFTLETKMESGRGKCPFEPSQQFTTVMADGILYAATVNNFLGTETLISRAMGSEAERIRTDTSLYWLSEPEFVSSAFVPESKNSNNGDDDKVYFFLTETAREYEFYAKVRIPRVARVCKGDIGGQKTLQKRWTTFLKAQLACEDPDTGGRFNILRDVYTLRIDPDNWQSTQFYGIFSSQWEREEVSAICVYTIKDISHAFNGDYKRVKSDYENSPSLEPPPSPRPGACITSAIRAQGYTSSLTLPDRVLTFVRDHPLMEQPVLSQAILVKRGTKYTKIAVNISHAGRDSFSILLLGTDRGELHKAVYRHTSNEEEALVIDKTTLFSTEQPIQNIQLYQDFVFLGSPSEVVKLPLANCSQHRSCYECVISRDPNCGWNTNQKECVWFQHDVGLLQDVNVGNATGLCPAEEGICSPPQKSMKAALGSRLILSCLPPSTWSSCTWKYPRQFPVPKQHVDGLEIVVSEESMGEYKCSCAENKLGCDMASYEVNLENPLNKALVGTERKYTVGVSFLLFMLGVLIGAAGICIYNRLTDTKPKEPEKLGLHYEATPNTPSSPSLASEGIPLTAKRNGLANGHALYSNINEICEESKENGDTPVIMKLVGTPLDTCEESSI